MYDVDAKSAAVVASQQLGIPLIDLDFIIQDDFHTATINIKLVQQYNVLPLFQRGSYLYLATDDPSHPVVFKEIQFHTGLQVRLLLVTTQQLKKKKEMLLRQNDKTEVLPYFDLLPQDPHKDIESSENAPVVAFVHKILQDAIQKGASDIHFEPYEQEYRIRYRQDGLLHEVALLPISVSARITARLKVMSNLDTSERRIPQDGRCKIDISETHAVDFRVSTCPTVTGEKVVLRIHDPRTILFNIEALGFTDVQKSQFLHAIHRAQGMVLITGPTGSGKTATLYSALLTLNTTDKNISTAEDPVELKIKGINQVAINPKAGLTFAKTLRSFLRQDPDIIMVGEMRDLETAEIAIKAAQTGHLVLSTLHTNSAAETLTRLMDMGIPPYNIAHSISLLVAERLVRKLCEYCKIPLNGSESMCAEPVFEAKGCCHCVTGYRGRIGLFEILPLSKTIARIILSGGSALEVLHQAETEGMLTIYQSGLLAVKKGLTTMEEINRVIVD